MTSVRLRMLSALFFGIALTVGTATAAFAFSPQLGFSATTYASGYPAGGPAGVAFIGTTMYAADPADDGFYSTISSGALLRLGTIPGAPTGLAAFGSTLYAIQSATNSVVQVDPASGAVLGTLGTALDFEGRRINGIAADPVSGDLYVSAAAGFIYKIPAAAPRTPAFWVVLNGQPATFGIAVAPDRQVYVAVEGLGSDGIRQITTSVAQSPIGPAYVGARGVGVIPGYIFVNNADGSITKIVIPGVGTGSTEPALTGGATGGLAGIGSDGCFYASQGTAVIRLAQTDGTCAGLGSAGPPPPPAALTLTNTSHHQPLIGNGDQTFDAMFTNVASPGGIAVTFTVTRGLSATTYAATTGPNGTATFGYTPPTPGIDIVTASAVVNAAPIASNAVTVNWSRALDLAKPTITYTVTGGHNIGPAFSCPSLTQGTSGIKEYCGWYTTPPTVHFTVTPNGPSGLDLTLTCPDYTLPGSSPSTGTPITCNAQNGDGRGQTALTVVLQALVTTPTIVATASTPSGPYVSGPTNQTVTVSFICASDPAFGPTAISTCTSPIPVSTEGSTTTVTGSVVDIAGTTRSTTFGPIFIDKTAPTISVVATLPGGALYTGAWTTQNVTLTYACADAGPAPSGIASCPANTTVTAKQAGFTATATDTAGNIATAAVGAINIDKTPPTVRAIATVSGVAYSGASATGGPVLVTFTCGTDGAPVTCPAAVTYATPGTFTATGTATDAAGNSATASFGPFTILATQPSTLTITSRARLPQGATIVTAKLLGLSGAPIAGRMVKFAAGAATATAVTDASGIATATLVLKPGLCTLTVSFAGDGSFLASTARSPLLVVAKEKDDKGDGKDDKGDGKGGTHAGRGDDAKSGEKD